MVLFITFSLYFYENENSFHCQQVSITKTKFTVQLPHIERNVKVHIIELLNKNILKLNNKIAGDIVFKAWHIHTRNPIGQAN